MFIEDIMGKKSNPKDIKDPSKRKFNDVKDPAQLTANPEFSFKKSRTDNLRKKTDTI